MPGLIELWYAQKMLFEQASSRRQAFFGDEGDQLFSKLVIEQARFERPFVSARGDRAAARRRVGAPIHERACERRAVGRVAGRVGVLAGDREYVRGQPAVARNVGEETVDDEVDIRRQVVMPGQINLLALQADREVGRPPGNGP